ncbi:MAG: SUMF1/EgtB/PvdO family nonheme iron enzyme, partial [Planctomycetota bacterium]
AQLPSAEEWSWAARGPENFEYAWGNDWRRDGCNANERDEHEGLAPSGSYPLDRSWCGAFDLTANATEWCRDAGGRPKCTGGSYLRGRDVCSFARPLGSSSKRRENLGFRALMLVD